MSKIKLKIMKMCKITKYKIKRLLYKLLLKLKLRRPLSTSDKITKIIEEYGKLAKDTSTIDNDKFIQNQLNIARVNYINKYYIPIIED
jgi:hypothetical protein